MDRAGGVSVSIETVVDGTNNQLEEIPKKENECKNETGSLLEN